MRRDNSYSDKSSISAVEIYRQWLDAESSGSEDDDHLTISRNLPKPISLQDPVNCPHMISPSKQLHPLESTEIYPIPSSKPHKRQISPSKILRGPRKLMRQMSLRTILTSQIPLENNPSHNENNYERNRRQSSMGTLFSDAWITRPEKIYKASRALSTDSHQTLYNVSLKNVRGMSSTKNHSDTKSTWRNEKSHKRDSVDWEFYRMDSKYGWWVVCWAFLACFVSLSTLINYPIYEAYFIANASRVEPVSLTDPARGQNSFAGVHLSSTYAVLIGTLMSSFAALGSLGAGTGLGVLTLIPAYNAILQHCGLTMCLYVQTLTTLILGLVSAFGLRTSVKLNNPVIMRWQSVLSDLRILTLMAMALFAAAARFAQLLCLPIFARMAGAENNIGGVLYTVGAALLVGMVLGGTAADKFGYIAGLGLSEVILGLFTLAMYTPSTSITPLYVFAVVFGLTTGTLTSVLPAAIAQMFGMQRLATTTGLVIAACAPALLFTTPAAIKFNYLVIEGSSVARLSAISGVLSIIAGFLGLMLPVLQRRYVESFTRKETTCVWPRK